MGLFVLVMIIACAVFYYRVGEYEYDSGWLLGAVSVTLWAVGLYLLGWGWPGNLLLQALLFVGLTLWNMAKDRRGT